MVARLAPFHSRNARPHLPWVGSTWLAVSARSPGIRACSRHDPRRHALRVLNAMLGESMSSRLFQLLREDKALAYSVYSSWACLDDTGALTISAGLDADGRRRCRCRRSGA